MLELDMLFDCELVSGAKAEVEVEVGKPNGSLTILGAAYAGN
ncbi:hypothetical protein [Nitrososphaera sp. AFS]|nr:hypothetical protein [Nitrososphaera sp. AFS]